MQKEINGKVPQEVVYCRLVAFQLISFFLMFPQNQQNKTFLKSEII